MTRTAEAYRNARREFDQAVSAAHRRLLEASRGLADPAVLTAQQRFVNGHFLPLGAQVNVLHEPTQDPGHHHAWKAVEGGRHRLVCTAMTVGKEGPVPCPAAAEWDIPSLDPEMPVWRSPHSGVRDWMPEEIPLRVRLQRRFGRLHQAA
jgi:hypothetical protein